MTLDNLVGLGLEVITPDAGAIKKIAGRRRSQPTRCGYHSA